MTPSAGQVAAGQRRRGTEERIVIGGDSYQMLTLPLRAGGAVQVAVNQDESRQTLALLALLLAAGCVLGIGGAALAGRAVARAGLVPVERLTKAVDTRYFFPSKLMELLVSGTPVLSTCTGHVEAEYGHVLYLLREETPEALAVRIREIRAIDPAERQRLGLRARDFMLREKTWDRQGERLARYIREDVLGMTSPHA